MHGSLPTSSDPLRVLIVEDDAANRDVMRMVLEMAGHRVSIAGTGEEALERVEIDKPDTVLLDLGLPDQNGSDVSEAIRAKGGTVPRIVITSGLPLEAKDLVSLGADAVLQKPFMPERLLAVLK